MAEIEEILVVREKYREQLSKKANVVGFGVGFRYKRGKLTDEQCLQVYVRQKLPTATLAEADILPTELEGVGLDVQVREARALNSIRTSRMRPAKCGISIGHYKVTAGTMGCVLWRGDKQVILSNNHVLAACDDANLGDIIVQPGIYDGGNPVSDRLGTLYDFVPLFTEGEAEVDAAICKPDTATDIDSEILEIGSPKGIAAIALGDAVYKSGRTTGLTEGKVTAVDVDILVTYSKGSRLMTNQIIADNVENQSQIAAGGDSGSVLLDGQHNLVGLLFAGGSMGDFLVANPIQPVMAKLNLTFEKAEPLPPPAPPLPPYEPPTADFIGTPVIGIAPLMVKFVSKATGNMKEYWWWFYGVSSEWQRTKDAICVYQFPGKYSVRHEVTDWMGATAEITRANYVTVLAEAPKPKPWWLTFLEWLIKVLSDKRR